MTAVMTEEAVESQTGLEGLLGQWRCCAHQPGSIKHPDELESSSEWIASSVPGTVASALDADGRWDWDHPTDIDAQDWWFRTCFDRRLTPEEPGGLRPPLRNTNSTILCLDGLATVAEVWLNGQLLLTTDNMFRRHRIDVSSSLQAENELVIGFRSLTESLKRKRPRPRWKTNLINNQQLRWHRTTLQGRIPGWSPPAPAIGPWRQVRLESGPVVMDDLRLHSSLDDSIGVVTIDARISTGMTIERALFRVGTTVTPLQLEQSTGGIRVYGMCRVPNARRWWPHTHGRPSLYECELVLESHDEQHLVECPSIGFRKLDVVTESGFQIHVNQVPVYCRGACWTVGDILNLTGTEESLRHDLALARDAGINMLRVCGTMVYESDLFYRLCDELGIMIWQDFMFANMDYPVDDESFRQNLAVEATEQLTRFAPHPCVAIYCGNSEVQQQAAMLGMPRDLWSNPWFTQKLPALCAEHHPGTAYVPSTPLGGTLPFQTNTALTHYYGVGAYLRPVTDVRRSDVKFTPETLGFANIPDASTIDSITGGSNAVVHDPRWKRRVPRDTGAGWDFDDVRDHYLRELFGVDPVQLRFTDTPRYLQLSRIVPGEMMHQVYSEWRSAHSRNAGGLVWFYKDLWPGAGWGIVDSTGTPKATYYYLKRAWSNQQLVMTDEGLNGLHVHLSNETAQPQTGTVEIQLLKEPHVVVARQEIPVHLDGRSQRSWSADEILGGFYDVSYAYRFGPAHHDIVIATWYDADRKVISEAFHFIGRTAPTRIPNVTLTTSAERIDDDHYRITLHSDRFLHGVQLTSTGFLPDDNFFHLAPQRSKTVTFRARSEPVHPFKVTIEALNLESSHVVSARSQTL